MISATLSSEDLDAMIDESYDSLASDLNRSRQLAEKALAHSPVDKPQHLQSLIMLAICDFNDESVQVAMQRLLDVISRYGNHEDKWLLRAFHYLGICYHHLSLYSEASQTHQKQYQLAEKLGDKSFMAAALRFMGADHDHMGQAQLSLEFYDKSIAIYESIDNYTDMAIVYYSKSIAYRILGRLEEGIAAGKKALALHEERENPRFLARVHGQMAVIFAEMANYPLALAHAEKAVRYAQTSELDESVALAYLQQGTVFRNTGQIEASIDALQKALRLVEATQNNHIGLDVHQELSRTYRLSRQFELAVQHQEQYQAIYAQQVEEAMRSRFENLSIVHRTQQAQAEAERLRQLREQDRLYFETLNQMKDELMSTASHDLKNPLTNIMTVLHLLKRHGRIDDERGKDLLERIDKSTRQMRDLITNLLDLARLETGKSVILQAQDMVAFASEIAVEYQLLAENQGLGFVFETAVETQIIHFDKLLMQQVFANLLSNALKFTPEKGKVTLSIVQEDTMLLIGIEDTGIGIPSDALAHVFERFYRVNKGSHHTTEGTGLGLAICKAIVEQHGGSIGVDSIEGQGSRFWLRLPL
jgi:signal transduction histidine kinase